jgi:hypothetical protein
MKYITFTALMALSILASANSKNNEPNPAIEHLQPGTHLDVSKVIDMTSDAATSNSCGPVEAHMIYLDSKGVKHDLAYTLEGYGCQNG